MYRRSNIEKLQELQYICCIKVHDCGRFWNELRSKWRAEGHWQFWVLMDALAQAPSLILPMPVDAWLQPLHTCPGCQGPKQGYWYCWVCVDAWAPAPFLSLPKSVGAWLQHLHTCPGRKGPKQGYWCCWVCLDALIPAPSLYAQKPSNTLSLLHGIIPHILGRSHFFP